MSAQYSNAKTFQEGVHPESAIRVPISSMSNHGIQLTIPRSNSKQMVMNIIPNHNSINRTQPEDGVKTIEPRPLSSQPSLHSFQNPQKIVLTSNQQRQGMTFVRLNNTIERLPPVQRVILRDPNQQVPESPERIIAHRFTVKSVDRENSRELSTSLDRPKPVQIVPFKDLMKEYLDNAERMFSERVMQQQSRCDHQLNKLEQKLKSAERNLNTKNEEVIRLKNTYEQALREQYQQHKLVLDRAVVSALKQEREKSQSSSSDFKQDMDRNFEYIAGRMRDIDVKIRLIIENQQSSRDNAQLNTNRSKLFMLKLDEVRRDLIDGFQKELIRIKKIVQHNLTQKEANLQSLEREVKNLYSSHTQNEKNIASLNIKINTSSTVRQLNSINQKVDLLSNTAYNTVDKSQLNPIQENLSATKIRLYELQKKVRADLKILSQQIKDYNSSVLTIGNKTLSQKTKIEEIQAQNINLTFRLKESELKINQTQAIIDKLQKQIIQLQTNQSDIQAELKSTQRNLKLSTQRISQLESKYTQTQSALTKASLNLDKTLKQFMRLETRNNELESILRKTEIDLQQQTKRNEKLQSKDQSNQYYQKQIKQLQETIDQLKKSNSSLNRIISELNRKLSEHDSTVKHLESIKIKLSSQKENTDSQNRDLQREISQMNIKMAELNSKCHETQSMIKTQSMRFFDPQTNQSNVYSSKGSFKSEQQGLSLKKTRSNRMESQDEQSNCSTLYRQTITKFTENSSKIKKEDLPERIIKLKEILKLNRKPLPLACEVDETGYLKDCEEGTYIYDKQHNLFVLSKEELARAVRNRIISL